MKKPLLLLWTAALIFSGPSDLRAATIWLNPGAVSGFDGKTRETGFSTMWEALDAMKSGDTLIIANGDWSRGQKGMTIESRDHLPPSGTDYNHMTVIRSETDWGVILPYIRDLGIGRNYVVIRGIWFSEGGALMKWAHAKLFRCGFGGTDKTAGPAAFAMSDGRFNLAEECLAIGGGPDAFLEYKSTGCIWRRCLAFCGGTDSTDKNRPAAGFRAKAGDGSVWQNCISTGLVSGRDPSGPGAVGFWVQSAAGAGETMIHGCLVLDGFFPAYSLSGATGKETAALAQSAALGLFPKTDDDTDKRGVVTCSKITASVQNILAAGRHPNGPPVAACLSPRGQVRVSDSITLNLGDVGQGATARRLWPMEGEDDDKGLIPVFENGLWYPVRPEENSPLAKGGGDGGPYGPVILYRTGVFGRAKDQPGWNKETTEPLWPFPNEAVFKQILVANGRDGGHSRFLEKGTDLTHTVWEWLGKPAPPFNLRALQAGDKLVLHWDALPFTENLAEFSVYNVSAGSETLWGKVMDNRAASTVLTGLTPNLSYGFSLRAEYVDKGESATVYPVFIDMRSGKPAPGDPKGGSAK